MDTFVVRVWRPSQDEEADPEPTLRGVVARPGSRDSEPFRTEEELLSTLRKAVAETQGGSKCHE